MLKPILRQFLIQSAIGLVLSTTAGAATPEEVDAMLDKAKVAIYAQRKGDVWETHPAPPTAEEVKAGASTVTGGQWGGPTALAVYALLAAGEQPQDPKLVPAIKFLLGADIKGTYALGIRSQLYNFLAPTKETHLAAEHDVSTFSSALIRKEPAKGLFDYTLESKRFSRVDHSVSQYGVLGLWACERSGAEVPNEVWDSMENAWIRDQSADGSWCYGKTPTDKAPNDFSMTVAGTATLFITQDYVHASEGINCTGNVSNKHIDAGLKWIGDNFDHLFSDKTLYAPYYGLYGVERVGVASGRKYLGDVDWYQRGADFLLKSQNKSGAWGGLYTTCFGTLFLSRGRAPVVMNKLDYDAAGKEANWNERPRDVANLTRWIAKKTERDLNWQSVSLKSSLGELLEAPLLYISGNKPVAFTPDEEEKLKAYCEAGGLILANPDCGSKNFADSFRKLGTRLFPDYEFRELPANHPIYTNEQYPRSTWKVPPALLSMSNGVREIMMMMPAADAARHWQLEEVGRFAPDFELADDVFLYAIDKKNLAEKGKTFFVTADDKVTPNRTIKLARLEYPGNWDPEPGGWRRLAALLQNSSHIKLDLSVVKLGSGQLGNGKSGPSVATLTGTAVLKLDTAARQEIKNFVEGKGTLIVDAAGGSTDFAASVETELQTILGTEVGKELKTPLPASSAVFNLPGGELKNFTYRSFARSNVGSLHGPLLAAVMVRNRPAVYYSRMDLSGGMVGQPTDGIIGYDPASATGIMTNLVISAGLGSKASVSPSR